MVEPIDCPNECLRPMKGCARHLGCCSRIWNCASNRGAIFTYVALSCNIALVKAVELIGQALSRDGTVLKLVHRSDEYIILANGKSLMPRRRPLFL